MDADFSPVLLDALVTMATKRTMLEADKHSIETIVVGSSHGDCAFNPSFFDRSFNLCSSSQDLKHSFSLYRHACQVANRLKRVIVFYSVFSPGFYLERVDSEKDKCVALNEIFSLGLQYADFHLEALGNKLRGSLGGLTFEAEEGSYSGFTPTQGKYRFPETYGAQRRALDHAKLNVSNEANVHLMDILLLAKSQGHEVYIVIPPVRDDYLSYLPGGYQVLFKDLIDVVGVFSRISPVPKTEIINFFESEYFADELFGDYDHLLPTGEGAAIISSKLQEHILGA